MNCRRCSTVSSRKRGSLALFAPLFQRSGGARAHQRTRVHFLTGVAEGRADALDLRIVVVVLERIVFEQGGAARVVLERPGERRDPREAQRPGRAFQRMRLDLDRGAVARGGQLGQQRETPARLIEESPQDLGAPSAPISWQSSAAIERSISAVSSGA